MRGQERPGEGIASVALGALKGLKGSRREVKAWHQEKNKGQAIGESTTLLQLEAQYFGDASTTG